MVKEQRIFKPFNQNSEQIVIDDMGHVLQNRQKLPNHLLKLGVSSDFINRSLIYQVDTIYSLWHSILALIYPEYVVMDYDHKRMCVLRFRDTINNEFINNQELRNKILSHKMRLIHVENSMVQEKIQDEILLRFFAIFFDINIYLISEENCYVYHNNQIFMGKPLNGSANNSQNDSEQNFLIEPYNPYKSSILLFRYPFGNIAPVFQEGLSSQIFTASNNSDFILPISTRFLGLSPEQIREMDISEIATEGSKVNKVNSMIIKVPLVKKTIDDIPNVKNDKVSINNRKDKSKSKFMSMMLKLKWDDIAALAEKELLKPLQPTTKGYDSWKKKTKSQLIEEIWDITNSKHEKE